MTNIEIIDIGDLFSNIEENEPFVKSDNTVNIEVISETGIDCDYCHEIF